MFIRLSIRDVVIIEKLDLNFQNGFSALTGETGAGKSILLDSLSLALGMRGDISLVRQDAEQAVVTAEFDLSSFKVDHPVFNILKDQGLDIDSNSLILKRILHRTQKSRAFINDQSVSISLLKEIGNLILEIHGQFDNLLNATLHHQILDRFTISHFLSFKELLGEVKKHYFLWREAEKELSSQQQAQQENFKKQGYYEELLKELEKLKLQENEEVTLNQQREAIAHYGKISDVVQGALKNLRLPQDIQSSLYNIQKNLEKANTIDHKEIQTASQAFERAGIEIQEATDILKNLHHLTEEGAAQLNIIDERLHTLRTVARKHGIALNELYSTYVQAKQIIADLKAGESFLSSFEKDVKEKRLQYDLTAQKIHSLHQQAAEKLEILIHNELPALKLPTATFKVSMVSTEPTALGNDQIEFLVSMNKGQPFSSLTKSASGGEMARLMLALKVVLSRYGDIFTIIFDEIDTGVGGATAAAIGQRLEQLSSQVQVMAITHSPQVAAHAHHHFKVTKTEESEKVITSISLLSKDECQEEIARMLSGSTITCEARAAAAQLLTKTI